MIAVDRDQHQPPWAGILHVSAGRALYVGPAWGTRMHRHHALQLTLSLEGDFEVDFERSTGVRFRCALLPADVPHRLEGRGQSMALYFVDRASTEGRALSGWLGGEEVMDLGERADALCDGVRNALAGPAAAILSLLTDRLADLSGAVALPTASEDSLVQRAEWLLEESLSEPIAVPELARRLGVAQRELSERFRNETGLAIRRYLLWLRLKTSVRALKRRRTLTEAAHDAGFSDAAHLSRTFAQMFGVSPSAILGASTIELDGDISSDE